MLNLHAIFYYFVSAACTGTHTYSQPLPQPHKCMRNARKFCYRRVIYNLFNATLALCHLRTLQQICTHTHAHIFTFVLHTHFQFSNMRFKCFSPSFLPPPICSSSCRPPYTNAVRQRHCCTSIVVYLFLRLCVHLLLFLFSILFVVICVAVPHSAQVFDVSAT